MQMRSPARSSRTLPLVLGLGLLACSSGGSEDSHPAQDEAALAAACTLGATCPDLQLVRAHAQVSPASLDGWIRGDVFEADEDVVFFRQETTRSLVLPAGKKIVLGGSATAEAPWSVDDALLVEVLSVTGSVRSAAYVGTSRALRLASGAITRFGRAAFDFAHGEIDLTSIVPADGAPFRLRVSAINGTDPASGNVARVSDVFLHTVDTTAPPPPPSSTPFDPATACPGPSITYAQLLAKFAPATSMARLADIVFDARQRACQDQTGCAEWQPASGVPFYTVGWGSSAYRFKFDRAVTVPQVGDATLWASSNSVTLSLGLSGVPGFTVSDTVHKDSRAVDFELNPLKIDGVHAQVGGWASNSSAYVWFHEERMTDHCLFATSSGRVYGSPTGAYTEYQAVFYGTY